MNDKSKRRMSIVLIDKKGKSQEILRDDMNNSNIIDIKEEKGAETINTSNKRREMDNKEKICKCEMCNKDKSKCETCKKNKSCDCKSNRSSISSNGSTVSTVSTVNRSNEKKRSNDESNGNKSNKNPNKNKDINNLVLNQNGFNSIDKKINDSMRNREGSSKDKTNESIKSIDKQMDYKSINDSINSINSDSIKNLNLVDNKKGNDSIKRESIKNDTFGSTQNAGNMEASKDMSDNNKSNGSMNKSDMNKGNKSDHKSNGSLKKGLAAGAVAGAGAGIVLGKSAQEEKKIKESEPQTNENKTVSLREDENNPKAVTIDENQNKEYSITRDPNKSLPLNEEEKQTGKSHTTKTLFVPPVISDENLPEDSEIRKERENNNVVGEGHMWKRRRIFACFWHEKYFVLTKEGILKYHKANGTKYSKGNWDLKKANRIHEVFLGAERHPYRLALVCDEDNLLFGYDDPDTREYWYNQFSKFIDF